MDLDLKVIQLVVKFFLTSFIYIFIYNLFIELVLMVKLVIIFLYRSVLIGTVQYILISHSIY